MVIANEICSHHRDIGFSLCFRRREAQTTEKREAIHNLCIAAILCLPAQLIDRIQRHNKGIKQIIICKAGEDEG